MIMCAGHKTPYLPGSARAPGSPVSWSAAEEGRRLLQKAWLELLVSLLGERSGHICILPSLLLVYMAKWHVSLEALCIFKLCICCNCMFSTLVCDMVSPTLSSSTQGFATSHLHVIATLNTWFREYKEICLSQNGVNKNLKELTPWRSSARSS